MFSEEESASIGQGSNSLLVRENQCLMMNSNPISPSAGTSNYIPISQFLGTSNADNLGLKMNSIPLPISLWQYK